MGQEGHVRMLEGRLHAYRVGVGLRIDEARVSIAGRAPDARALPPLALVQHDPERHVEWPVSEPRPVVVELLDPGLVTYGGGGGPPPPPRGRRTLAAGRGAR